MRYLGVLSLNLVIPLVFFMVISYKRIITGIKCLLLFAAGKWLDSPLAKLMNSFISLISLGYNKRKMNPLF
jgi:hypothetical protein